MPFTEKNWVDSPSTSTPISAAALEDMETRLSDYSDESPSFVDSPSWSAGYSYRDGSLDGLFYIKNWTDDSGDDSPLSYSKMFGGYGDKTGPGNMDAHWASINHYGAGEAGLFIGDVTAKSGGSGGNLWGGHFYLAAETAANMQGLLVELAPTVDMSAKQTFGVEVRNNSATYQLDQALRIAGDFERPIIVYDDAGGTTVNFDIDASGNIRWRGSLSAVTGGLVTISDPVQLPSIEARASGGNPFIDFSNDLVADYDVRLQLLSDDVLQVVGGSLRVVSSGFSIGTEHVGAATPTGGTAGDIKVGNSKIWVNDAGTWKSVAVA